MLVTVFAPDGLPEIVPGDDLAALMIDLFDGPSSLAENRLIEGDIVVVTSKIVSKAEGRVVVAADREAAISAETVRVVASRAHPGGVTRIVQNRQGLVMAAAGVDASNVEPGTVLLLPEDPDASAFVLASRLRRHFGARIGVLITDTAGRAWREGQIDLAIGAAGLRVIEDHRGGLDSFGQRMSVTQIAVADEIAGAAELVKGKVSGRPVAVLRGRADLVTADLSEPTGGSVLPVTAKALLRSPENDMFFQGAAEADEAGYRRGYTEGVAASTAGPVGDLP